jgi:hypothetical protein
MKLGSGLQAMSPSSMHKQKPAIFVPAVRLRRHVGLMILFLSCLLLSIRVEAQARGYRQLTVCTRRGYYPGESVH